MSYVALYRKYRSQNFDEVIGQPAIVKTLKNAIERNRLSHAYLFSGPRGTGKTSVARILAKALNCKNGPTGSPCGKCDQCVKIRDGHAVDVIEIDAASNRGIDEIRDLRERVRYAPVEGKFKVYIIDEVHMLTTEAFNALLKTLEEPPSHTIFALATTEPQKVPVTISSRCQRLDFARIPLSLIMEHLKKIAKNEGFEIEEKALNLIARASEGSMRDAISLLDQLVSFCGKTIKFDDVVLVLGTADEEFLFSMVEAISDGNLAAGMSLIEKAVVEGRSITQITRDLLGHIRYILLAKLGAESVIDLTKEYVERVMRDSGRFTVDNLKELIKIFSRAELDMRWHPHPRLILEVALVEAMSKKGKEELEELEVKEVKKVKEVKEVREVKEVSAGGARLPDGQGSAFGGKEAKPFVAEKISGNGGDLLLKVKENWNHVLDSVKKKSLFGYVSLHEGAPVKINERGKLVIGFKKGFSFHKERLEEAGVKSAVESSLSEALGREIPIECIISDDIAASPVKSSPSRESRGLSADSIKDFFSGKIVS